MPAAEVPASFFFNNALAKLRIISEHAIGSLEGGFQSLKELRIKIKAREDLTSCCEHIIALV